MAISNFSYKCALCLWEIHHKPLFLSNTQAQKISFQLFIIYSSIPLYQQQETFSF